MADAIGINGLHSVAGKSCDLCGLPCDPGTEDLNALGCTFPLCPHEAAIYHQDCLEKYLKSIRCEKNRKTGFKCPRGCGKGTKFNEPCPGKIDKSHPIHMRSDLNKKKKKAKQPEVPAPPPPKATVKGAKSNNKKEDDGKVEKDKHQADRDHSKPTSKFGSVSSLASSSSSKSSLALKGAQAKRDVACPAVSAFRKEAGVGCSSSRLQQGSAVKEYKTFDEYEASKVASNVDHGVPLQNAWSSRSLSAVLVSSHSQSLSEVGSPLACPTPAPVSKRPPADVKLPQPVLPDNKLQGAWAHRESPFVPPPTSGFLHSQPLYPPPPPPPPRQLPAELTSNAPQKDTGIAPTEGEVKLTKAQRKNLKRAEKKAAARKAAEAQGIELSENDETGDTSVESHGRQSVDFSDVNFSVTCLEAVALRKVYHCVELLHQIGFAEDKCLLAVSQYGDELEPAVAFLLKDSLQSHPDSSSAQLVTGSAAIDVADEVLRLQDLQSWLGCATQVIEQAVIDCFGDIEAAASLLFERLDQTSQDSTNSWYSERPHLEGFGKYPSSLGFGNNPFQQKQHEGPRSNCEAPAPDPLYNQYRSVAVAGDIAAVPGVSRAPMIPTRLPDKAVQSSCITPDQSSWQSSADSGFATYSSDYTNSARLRMLEQQQRYELFEEAAKTVRFANTTPLVVEPYSIAVWQDPSPFDVHCSQQQSQLPGVWSYQPQDANVPNLQSQHSLPSAPSQWAPRHDTNDLPAQQEVPEAALLAAAAVASEADTTNISSEDLELSALITTLMCQ